MSLREPAAPLGGSGAKGAGAAGDDVLAGDEVLAAGLGQKAAGRPDQPGGLAELLGRPLWLSRALLGLGLAAVGLGTYWGIFAWGPELAARAFGAGASPGAELRAASRAYLLMNFTGGLAGLLSFAPWRIAWAAVGPSPSTTRARASWRR